MVLHIVQYLDGCDMIKLYRSCKHFYNMLRHSPTWWKTLVHREEMQSYEHLGKVYERLSCEESKIIV